MSTTRMKHWAITEEALQLVNELESTVTVE